MVTFGDYLESMEAPIALFPNASEFRLDAVRRDDLRHVLTLVVTSTGTLASCRGRTSHTSLCSAEHRK